MQRRQVFLGLVVIGRTFMGPLQILPRSIEIFLVLQLDRVALVERNQRGYDHLFFRVQTIRFFLLINGSEDYSFPGQVKGLGMMDEGSIRIRLLVVGFVHPWFRTSINVGF